MDSTCTVYKVEENSSCALPKVAAPSTLPCCPLQPPQRHDDKNSM